MCCSNKQQADRLLYRHIAIIRRECRIDIQPEGMHIECDIDIKQEGMYIQNNKN